MQYLVWDEEQESREHVVKLFRETLGYDYLGNRIDRVGSRNIDVDLSRSFLNFDIS
jgi:type I restriction enzyme R subunit